MRVLHVLDHSLPLTSGYSTRSRSIALCQREAGLEPVVLTSPRHAYPGGLVETRDGIRHYRTAPVRPSRRLPHADLPLLMARLGRRIVEVARAEGVDLLHVHSPVLNGLPALWAARRLGVPVVYEARAFWEDAAVDHGTTREGSVRYRLSRALETWLFRRVAQVVVIAEAMRREIAARGVPAERITVVPNGVDLARFRPAPRDTALAGRLGLDGGPVFGFIGSFYRYEGLAFLMQALPELQRHLPGVRLLLVGGGEEEDALRAMARPHDGTVVFAGRVNPDGVGRFYPLLDVFVCPRRRMRLTELVTPLKPLEAMAMERPVLASDVGGHAELIRHGETGCLFPAESRERFVDECVRLAGAADWRQGLAERGRRFVESERTWARLVTRYLPVYRAALQGAPA
ncbi:MAG TPA: TIGR04063 family PEP-CTERM/XrtA system glycosyltransferase [Candidatus Binatia bacterium]|nr:TIGR04063 family PEP-CTERM/XrtA system glycosyltransferase [Candidatus Binatia bacterium]